MTSFCTYVTTYTGDKLPPFYIGYTTVEKVLKGYHGSVNSKQYKVIWLQELKENPHLFDTVIQQTYDTQEEAIAAERELLESVEAHKNPMYINMSIGGEKFYTPRKYMTEEEVRQANLERSNQRYQANKEALREKARQYVQVNREAINEKARQYHQATREARSEYTRQRYQANKEALREKVRQYVQANQEARNEYARQYYHARKAERDAKKKGLL